MEGDAMKRWRVSATHITAQKHMFKLELWHPGIFGSKLLETWEYMGLYDTQDDVDRAIVLYTEYYPKEIVTEAQ
jgi:hypothetical protein